MTPYPPSPDKFLPLKPVAFEILLALGEGDRHGYAITQEIAARTATKVTVEPGNLYRSIKTLLEDALVIECAAPAGESSDERRRYYRITELGREVAAAETARLEAVLADARSRTWLKGQA
jgi:DNA-binding PadR family transcriptional regulator